MALALKGQSEIRKPEGNALRETHFLMIGWTRLLSPGDRILSTCKKHQEKPKHEKTSTWDEPFQSSTISRHGIIDHLDFLPLGALFWFLFQASINSRVIGLGNRREGVMAKKVSEISRKR